jgi:hypothetical protein
MFAITIFRKRKHTDQKIQSLLWIGNTYLMAPEKHFLRSL